MCLPLVARVIAVDGERAEVELHDDGQHARVSLALWPDVAVGAHVLVDRGMIIEVVDPAQLDALLALYAELAQMWDSTEDATHTTAEEAAAD